ncbi:glycosyltransferase family 4 protein [Leptospira barantonii]|uniref:Glycosyltransferase family 4 protein n=1 Tax=Leptospira barantonii TaxID=2023184 RepID=A0A5F2AXJ9_9LEPT|nr:glycosyltransferase [Leptospira barantonii]TGL92058.1 glycosyltransferase family 4 protein [Leptospira barantonii]
MKVAIIHDWLNGMRGGELVLDSLLKIYPTADLFTLFYTPGKLNPRIEQRKITTAFTNNLPFKDSKYRWYLPLFPTAIESLDLKGYDLVISSSHCVAKGVITDPDSIHFSYVHSPMRYVWDLYYDYFPSRKGLKFFAFEAISNYLRTWDVASSSRVDSFWSNSKFVARRIQKFYRREAKVIFPPCLPEKWKVDSQTKDDFYLIVSAFAPYKRIDLAIETFRKNGKRLVLIGGGQEFKKLTSNLPKNIEILPHLKREEVLEYYKKAKAFIFPGMEDFGIAPVEAQAYATPVIAFGKGGALETVVAGKTGVFFPEQTVESLQVAIEQADRISWKTSDFQKNVSRFTEEKFIIEIKKQVENRIRTPRKKG